MRVGLSTGPAIVANVGSRRRFNYTTMGDAVNVAARLETANKECGMTILTSAAVRDAAGTGFAWSEIGRIQVKGRAEPIGVFEPIDASPQPQTRPVLTSPNPSS